MQIDSAELSRADRLRETKSFNAAQQDIIRARIELVKGNCTDKLYGHYTTTRFMFTIARNLLFHSDRGPLGGRRSDARLARAGNKVISPCFGHDLPADSVFIVPLAG